MSVIPLSRKEVINLVHALEDAYENLQTEFGPYSEQERVKKQTMEQINFVRRLLQLGPYWVDGNHGDSLPEREP